MLYLVYTWQVCTINFVHVWQGVLYFNYVVGVFYYVCMQALKDKIEKLMSGFKVYSVAIVSSLTTTPPPPG